VRILEQLIASAITLLSLRGRQFMRRFSTVFPDLAKLMSPWNVEFSKQSASAGYWIGCDHFMQGLGIHSDWATKAWFVFEPGVPVTAS
jgi:hypothetical protein